MGKIFSHPKKRMVVLTLTSVVLGLFLLWTNVSAESLQDAFNPEVTLDFSLPLPPDVAERSALGPHPAVEDVFLSGSFNNWRAFDPQYRLTKVGENLWTLKFRFPRGETQYKFVVNLQNKVGMVWVQDLNRGRLVSDNMAGFNTLYTVPDFKVFLFYINVTLGGLAAIITAYLLVVPLFRWMLRWKMPLRYKLVFGLVIVGALTNFVIVALYEQEQRNLVRLSLKETLTLVHNVLDGNDLNWQELQTPAQRDLLAHLMKSIHGPALLRVDKSIQGQFGMTLSELLLLSPEGDRVYERSSRLNPATALARARQEGFSSVEDYFIKGILRPLLKSRNDHLDEYGLFIGISPEPLMTRSDKDLSGATQSLGFNTFLAPVYSKGRLAGWFAGELDVRLYGEQLEKTRWFVFYLVVLSLLGAGLILITIGKVLTSHIRELIGWTDRILIGDYSHTLTLATGDEIQTLAENFEHMRAGLQRSFATIETQHRRLLTEAYEDKLTKLPNRHRLFSDLESPSGRSLILFNIDGFQKLNDFFGHEVGDKVLIETGKRLKTMTGTVGKVYKISSDEFVVTYAEVLSRSSLSGHAQSLLSALMNTSYIVDGQEVFISFSAGGTVDEGQKDRHYRPSRIVAEADMAMKRAKGSSIRFEFFTPDMGMKREYGRQIIGTNLLREALKEGRIVPYFQPIVDTRTGAVSKYECLVRLVERDGTVLAPAQFLDIAKKARFYPFITKVMLFKSMLMLKNTPWEFSLNLSVEDLLDAETRTAIESAMAAAPDVASRMVYEIVESEEIKDYDAIRDYIEDLRALGAKIAIDDFGTGYSNFEYLLKLKVDYLKIDAGLIKNIDTDQNSQSVTRAVVRFAQELGIKTVAEYVHSESVFKKVLEYGIDYAQGYYFGEPTGQVKANGS